MYSRFHKREIYSDARRAASRSRMACASGNRGVITHGNGSGPLRRESNLQSAPHPQQKQLYYVQNEAVVLRNLVRVRRDGAACSVDGLPNVESPQEGRDVDEHRLGREVLADAYTKREGAALAAAAPEAKKHEVHRLPKPKPKLRLGGQPSGPSQRSGRNTLGSGKTSGSWYMAYTLVMMKEPLGMK